jgi:hypothetical protein
VKWGLRLGGIAMMVVGAVLAVVCFTAGPKAPEGELGQKMNVKEKVITGAYKTYGVYVLSPNGDVSATIKLTPPMIIYQKLRESVSNLYLVLRQFPLSRADTEVVDKKADWDDSNRTMTFSMKLLGGRTQLG